MARSIHNNSGQAHFTDVGNNSTLNGRLIPGYGLTNIPTTIEELRDWLPPGLDILDDEVSQGVSDLVSSGDALVIDDILPPATIDDLTATTDELDKVELTFTAPSDMDLLMVAVLRKIGSAPTGIDDADATLVECVTNVFPGAATTVTDTTALDGITYHYAALAYDTQGHVDATLTPAENLATGMVDAPPDTIRDLKAALSSAPYGYGYGASDMAVTLTWTNDNPPNADLDVVKVIRKANSAPTAHNDALGTQVYWDGSPTEGAPATYAEVLSTGIYYYGVYSKDANGNWSTSSLQGLNVTRVLVV